MSILYAAASLGFVFGFFLAALLVMNKNYRQDRKMMSDEERDYLKEVERIWGQKW